MRFPIEADDLVSTVVRLLVAAGSTRAVALLTVGESDVYYTKRIHYMNEPSPTDHWLFRVHIPPKLYAQIEHGDRVAAEEEIHGACAACTKGFAYDRIEEVVVLPKIVPDDQWRQKAIAWLRGEGITNQGRVRSDNIASRQHDGLLFRSGPEIMLYRALKAKGVSFAPLPVFIRGGTDYRRIEPDFIIVKDGAVMAVEVDGDTMHHETPVEAHNRTTMLVHEGVYLERVNADACDTEERAMACAAKLLAILAKRSRLAAGR